MALITNDNTPTLSLEILDRIFSFLDYEKSTWSTLKAIHDPILRAAIDRRMYTHIELGEWSMTQICHKEIYHYLSRNRHVANYIRTLVITITDDRRMKKSHRWYKRVSSILQMLTSSLEKITFSYWIHIAVTRSGGGRIVPAVWSDFPSTFRKAFLHCLWSPNIIEVSMERIGGFPLSFFNPCTRLKRLSLLQVECAPSTSDAQFPPQIDSLVLSRSEDLPTIVSWAKTGHDLRSLNFRLDQRADHKVGYGELIGLLDSFSEDLIELELDFRSLTPSDFDLREGWLRLDPPLTLSHNHELTQLTVHSYLLCGSDSGLCVRSLIPGIISLVATSPSLKHLILRASINPWEFDVTVLPDFCRPLVSLVNHCSLEHIELRIISSTVLRNEKFWQGIILSDILMKAPELKRLCSKGFLSVTGPEFEEWMS